jgi:acyl-CoA dehydrogenase
MRLVVRYASEREQFGRPINTFQAVASHLARIAEETAMVSAAADLVVFALAAETSRDEVAMAKAAAGESASTVARLAHQVHGAIGVTAECDLQLFTRRLLSWRDEHGGEAFWAREVGRRLFKAGTAGAWDIVAAPVGRHA